MMRMFDRYSAGYVPLDPDDLPYGSTSSNKVAAQYILIQEVKALSQRRSRVASLELAQARRELTPEVLLAFVEDRGARVASVRQALDIVKKIKKLWEAFATKKGAWEDFKKVIGVRADSLVGALAELPRKIQDLVKKGKDLLSKVGKQLVDKVPLFKIYFEARAKMPNLNDYLLKLVDYLPPKVSEALKKVGKGATKLAEVLDEYVQKHPLAMLAGTVASAALFTTIWMNVTEISWDLPEILRGFLGKYSFSELLVSLPEAGVGFILSLLFPGLPSAYLLNALLPLTVALRLAWMVGQKYASWDNGSLKIDWDKLGVNPPENLLVPA